MKESPNYYAVLSADVRYDSRLKANEKLLYAELTALCKAQGYCWANNRYFAELYNVSNETVSRWLGNLKACGYLTISYDEQGENKRIIHLKDGSLTLDKKRKGVDEKIKGHDKNIKPPLTKTSSPPLTKSSNIIIQELNNTSLINSSSATAEPEEAQEPSVSYAEVRELYNALCPSLRTCKGLSEKRKKAIHARLKSGYTLDDFREVFTKAQVSAFLKGKNKRDWQADFDWLICDSNMAKVLDGKYDDKAGANKVYGDKNDFILED